MITYFLPGRPIFDSYQRILLAQIEIDFHFKRRFQQLHMFFAFSRLFCFLKKGSKRVELFSGKNWFAKSNPNFKMFEYFPEKIRVRHYKG